MTQSQKLNPEKFFSDRLTKTFDTLVRQMNRRPFEPQGDKNYLLMYTEDGEVKFATYHNDRFRFPTNSNKAIVGWVELPIFQEILNDWSGVWKAKINERLVEVIVVDRKIVAIEDPEIQGLFLNLHNLTDCFEYFGIDLSNEIDSFGFIMMGGWVVGQLDHKQRGEKWHKVLEDWKKKSE